MKKINLQALIAAALRASAVFVILDFGMEYIVIKFFGISVLKHLEQGPFGIRFHVVNLLLIFLEMLLIMYVYTIIRPGYSSNIKAGLVTSALFILFTALLMAFLVNIGVFTVATWLLFLLFYMIELPVAVLLGAAVYGDGG